jgi:hypothetical protein
MKMINQTKYFRKVWNSEDKKFEYTEIPFNRDNWFYVQMDASVRTAFLKYNCHVPKYGIIEELPNNTMIYLFRDDIKTEIGLVNWEEKWRYVQSELDIQAEVNSNHDDNLTSYKFKIL